MKRDEFTLPLAFPGELIIDNFAGGGGTSTGLEAAFGRPVDIAINHDPEGLATRQVAEMTDTPIDWLEAWWMEHHFGERPMRAGLVGEELRDIVTLEELVELICDCKEKDT